MYFSQERHDDENIGGSDEELYLQMISLARPDADLKDKDEKSSLFTDIWRCFTTVLESSRISSSVFIYLKYCMSEI